MSTARCQAVGMTAHNATRRLYIDQLKTAAAFCRLRPVCDPSSAMHQ